MRWRECELATKSKTGVLDMRASDSRAKWSGLFGTILCALMAYPLSVAAADLPVGRYGDVPTLVPGISFNWTGLYFGANVGYGRGSNGPSVSGPGIVGSASETLSGAIGGGQLGFNWQVNNWVFGIETDIQASGQTGSVLYAGIAQSDKNPWFGTARGRLGVAFDRWLVYTTAGAAYGENTRDLTGAVAASIFKTTVGFTAGGGVETAFSTNWSAKLEYLYVDIGTVSGLIGKFTVTSNYADNVVRVGVNYKWGGLLDMR